MIGRAEQHIGPAHPPAGVARRAPSESEAPPASHRFHSPHQLTPCSPLPASARACSEPTDGRPARESKARALGGLVEAPGTFETQTAVLTHRPGWALRHVRRGRRSFPCPRLARAAWSCCNLPSFASSAPSTQQPPAEGCARAWERRQDALRGRRQRRAMLMAGAHFWAMQGVRGCSARGMRGARATLLRSKGLPALLSRRAVCSSSAAQQRFSATGQGDESTRRGKGRGAMLLLGATAQGSKVPQARQAARTPTARTLGASELVRVADASPRLLRCSIW